MKKNECFLFNFIVFLTNNNVVSMKGMYMLAVKNNEKLKLALAYLPERVGMEISRVVGGRREGAQALAEIRIRAGGVCSLVYAKKRIPLFASVSVQEMADTVKRLSEGALYAYRDSIAGGYISLAHGIRVGICGYAKYEDGALVGVSDLRSLVFRIPSGECEFGDEIYRIYRDYAPRGMLIYSPPGVGKTTALRSLAVSIGSGSDAKRVAVIDERCEFPEEDFASAEVDILKGYKRKSGIEIATRTMSPEVIMIDEIGADEAVGVASAIRTGIPFIATAHAGSFDELLCKPGLAPLFECGAFDLFVGISVSDGRYQLAVNQR